MATLCCGKMNKSICEEDLDMSVGANITPDSPIITWLIGVGSSLVIFFLAWGLKDVKARYDKIPKMETDIALLCSEIKRLKRKTGIIIDEE